MSGRGLLRAGVGAAMALGGLAFDGLAHGARAEGADAIMARAQEQRRLATCVSSFVWREAVWNDYVCVPPPARARVAEENRLATSRRAGGGAYGGDTCKPGFVWRDAFANDHVCVTPDARNWAAEENRLASVRRVGR